MEDNLRNLVDANRTDIAKINKDIIDLQNVATCLYNNQKALDSAYTKLGVCVGASIGLGLLALFFGIGAAENNNAPRVTVEKKYYFSKENEGNISESVLDDAK